MLLTRDKFRESVFKRDRHKCVACGGLAVDAHHIIERKRWKDGGYYLDNGASVCETCHIACEKGVITVEQIREYAGITNIVLPDDLSPNLIYDKWGKTMETILKYPRTRHLEGSCLQRGDEADRMPLADLPNGPDDFYVWEEKVDGANCGISFDDDGKMVLQSRGHVLTGGPRERQFDLFKQWASVHEWSFQGILGRRYIMYGEWCYAKHTIFYDRLPHYFLEFDVLDKEENEFLTTEQRQMLFYETPVVSVPVVHTGRIANLKDLKELVAPSLYKSPAWQDKLWEAAGTSLEHVKRQTDLSDMSEGLYLKHERDGEVVGRYKWVRSDFLQTIVESDSHWHDRPILPNQLDPNVDIFS